MLSQHDLIYIYEDKVFRQLCIGNRLVRSPVTEAELDAQIAGALLLKDCCTARWSKLTACQVHASVIPPQNLPLSRLLQRQKKGRLGNSQGAMLASLQASW